MATQPRMSAPIGRVRIKTGKKPGSGQRWRPAEPPIDEEVSAEAVDGEPRRPSFYPFPLRSRADSDD